jgi:tetratricopeptide (TPR) repeat protein
MHLTLRTRESLDLVQANVYRCMGTRQGTRNCLALAMDIYSNILAKFPNHIEALFGCGLVNKSMHAYDKALGMFQRVLNADSGYFNASLELALTKYLQNDLDGSMEICRELLADPDRIPDTIQALCLFQIARINWLDGICLILLTILEAKRLDKALCFTNLLQSAKKDSNAPHTFNYLGNYYLFVEDRQRAIKCFQKAHTLIVGGGSRLIIDDSLSDPSQTLCTLLLEDDSIDDAVQVLDGMIQVNSRDFWPCRQLGIISAVI